MGISTETTLRNKRRYAALVADYADCDPGRIRASLKEFLHPEAVVNVVQPINRVDGAQQFLERVMEPLLGSFRHLHRRSDMLFGGEYHGAEWVVSHGHYMGEFVNDWMGIPAHGGPVWLHYAEFHRMEAGRSVECYLYSDMLDLLRQLGKWPLPRSVGHEGFIPGPGTGDGMLLSAQDPEQSRLSLKTVEDMLGELWTEDEGWRPYWHRNMCWYGPSGYGSYFGLEGFCRFQQPYEGIFDPGRFSSAFRKSGDARLDGRVKGHYARFSDGNYVACGGWPSHGGFMVRPWLGVEGKGQMFTVRLCDFWRRSGDLLVENWVLIDLVEMLLQLEFDVFRQAGIELQLP